MYKTKASVKVKNDQNVVVMEKEYDKIVFEGTHAGEKDKPVFDPAQAKELLKTAIDFLSAEVGEKGNGVFELLSHVTYAYDLGIRNKIRQALTSGAAGPEKNIERMAKEYMAAREKVGKPVTWEKALEKAKRDIEEE